MKTLVCVNVLDSVKSVIYGSHCQEWYRLGRNTTDSFILFHPERFSIDNARNQAARIAMETECDYIYFIDDDMILSPNTYQSLRDTKADVAMALTFIRGYPFEPMFFKFKDEEKKKLEYFRDYIGFVDSNGIIKCDAVGFACCLIKVDKLLKLTKPYFVTGTYHTEDVYFCLKLKEELGDEISIVVDTKVPTGHLLNADAISVHNREKMIEQHASDQKPINGKDRGKQYLDEVIPLFRDRI